MGFTTTVFFFVFLPLMLMAYYACAFLCRHILFFNKIRLKDVALLILCLLFYAWACVDNAVWLMGYILIIYLFGYLIKAADKKYLNLPFYTKNGDTYEQCKMLSVKQLCFVITAFIVVMVLIRYKYADFINGNFSFLNNKFHGGMMATVPLGISFIVFSTISYLADIKNGKAEAGNLLDCALYLTFFPKIISGPIVLWRDFKIQITSETKISLERITDGINRMAIGFAKKTLLADFFGKTIYDIGASCGETMDRPTVWICVFLYMLQIYYDFAGYSDISIGLAKILGFDFKENFNFPYRSLSITEFWKRWHISLGTWFREYVYIPLGGNRKGLTRTLINLGVVFLLTGFWHGASWGYIIWGVINGVIVILERIYMRRPVYKKVPSAIKWAGTMFIVMLFWQFFRYNTIVDVLKCFVNMVKPGEVVPAITWKYFLDHKVIAMAVAGSVGATVFGSEKLQAIWKKFTGNVVGYAIQELGLILLLLLSLISIASSTYNPFIYFQF